MDIVKELISAADTLGSNPAAEYFRWLAEMVEEEVEIQGVPV